VGNIVIESENFGISVMKFVKCTLIVAFRNVITQYRQIEICPI